MRRQGFAIYPLCVPFPGEIYFAESVSYGGPPAASLAYLLRSDLEISKLNSLRGGYLRLHLSSVASRGAVVARLTIYRKMVIGFGGIILLMIGPNGYTLLELSSLTKSSRAILTSDVRSIELAMHLQTLLYEGERNARKYVITRDGVYYDLFQEASRQFQENLDLLARAESGEELHLLRQIAQSHEQLAQSVVEEPKRGHAAILASDPINKARMKTVESLDLSLDRLVRLKQGSIGASLGVLGSAAEQFLRLAVGVVLLAWLAASLAAWIIARTMVRPMSQVIRATRQIAKGSFEPIRISSNDEMALLADAVNEMGEQLKKADEFKSNLAHEIVHELRTPLQVIFSAQTLLADDQNGSVDRPEMLRLIRRSVENLMKFTNQFLDIAKIERGMMEYHLAPTDLLSILAGTVEDANTFASSKGISIAVSAPHAPLVLADHERLSQMFSNLLSNAIKYTGPRGTIEVTVSCSEKWARVAVKDSGVGIAPEDISRLFTKFYRGSNAASTGAGGTGLGLALVKALVEGHGGKISVESSPGMGSIFTVEIPLAHEGKDFTEAASAAG